MWLYKSCTSQSLVQLSCGKKISSPSSMSSNQMEIRQLAFGTKEELYHCERGALLTESFPTNTPSSAFFFSLSLSCISQENAVYTPEKRQSFFLSFQYKAKEHQNKNPQKKTKGTNHRQGILLLCNQPPPMQTEHKRGFVTMLLQGLGYSALSACLIYTIKQCHRVRTCMPQRTSTYFSIPGCVDC